MTEEQQAAEIARELSRAQKRALLWLPAAGMWRGPAGRLGMALTLLVVMNKPALAEREWDGPWDAYNYRATPLGLAVRAALAQERLANGELP